MITQEEALAAFEYRDGKVYWKIAKQKVAKGSEAGTLMKSGYVQIMCGSKVVYAHRLIFLMHHGYLPKEIDHINGKRNDNRIENLRESNRSQNMWNRKINCNNTSGVKGVHRHGNKWRAAICVGSKSKHIGVFDTIEEAKKAVEAYRIEQHKEFARHE